MQLKSLTMKNFINHADTQIDFAPVTMIFGGNDQGKSSIRDAIQYAFNGVCRGVKYKKNKTAYAKDGAKSFDVKLDTDSTQEIDSEVVNVATDPWHIIHMSADDRQKFFTRFLLPAETSKPKLSFDVDSKEFGVVLQILETGDVDKAEKEAIGVRRELKRLIAANVMPEIPSDTIEVGGSKISLSTVNGQYSERYQQRQNERGMLAAQLANIGSQSQADLEARKAELERWFAEQTPVFAEIEKKLGESLPKLAAIDKEIAEAEKQIASVNGEIRVYEGLARVSVKPGICPLCKQTSPKGFSIALEIENTAKALHAKALELTKSLDQKKKNRLAITDENQIMMQERDALNRDIESNKIILVGTVKQLALVGQKDALQKQIADLDGKLASPKQIIDAARDYKAASAQAETVKSELIRLAGLLEQAEKVCTALSADGEVRSSAASKAEEIQFDELTGPWGLESLKLTRDGEIILNGRPIEFANKAQQYRVGVIVALKVAQKVGFIVIDEFDQLKANFQMSLMQRLTTWKDQISVVILAAVDTPPQPAKVEWLKKLWVENGSVKEVA